MRCQKCNTVVASHPLKNQDGSLNWKNILIGNPLYLWIFLSIMMIVYGVNVFTEDCMQIKDYPDQFCDQWCDFKFKNAIYDNSSFRGYSLPDNVTFNFTVDS